MNLQRAPLDSLDPEIQTRLIELSDTLDQRQYEYYCRSLESQAAYGEKELAERSAARKQAVWVFATLAFGGLVFLSGVTWLLLGKDQFSTAQTIVISGMTFVSGLLGGSGLTALMRRFAGTQT